MQRDDDERFRSEDENSSDLRPEQFEIFPAVVVARGISELKKKSKYKGVRKRVTWWTFKSTNLHEVFSVENVKHRTRGENGDS